MRYVWLEGRAEKPLKDGELEQRLERLSGLSHADVGLLLEDESGAPSGGWLYRLLGLKVPTDREGVLVQIHGDEATLTYVDQDWHETRAFDPARAELSGETVFGAKGAEQETVPRSECVRREDAMDALRRFAKAAPKPEGLKYRKTVERR